MLKVSGDTLSHFANSILLMHSDKATASVFAAIVARKLAFLVVPPYFSSFVEFLCERSALRAY